MSPDSKSARTASNDCAAAGKHDICERWVMRGPLDWNAQNNAEEILTHSISNLFSKMSTSTAIDPRLAALLRWHQQQVFLTTLSGDACARASFRVDDAKQPFFVLRVQVNSAVLADNAR